MGTILANLLISEAPLQHLRYKRRLLESFSSLDQVIQKSVEELQTIVLFPQVYRLSPQFKRPPETVRGVVLVF